MNDKSMKTLARMVLVGAAIVAKVLLGTDKESAENTLKQDNLKVLEVGGADIFASKDFYNTKFKALNASGDTVKGVVSHGFFSNSTIRYDN
jgi:hypothetical protein